MELSSGQYLQLILALSFGVVLFSMAYTLPEKVIIATLIILIRFQPITSSYGTLNTVLAYMIVFAFYLRKEIKVLPMLGWVVFILFAYLASMSFSPKYTWVKHGTYIIGVGANFLLFFLVYNYLVKTGDYKGIFRIFIALNIIVAIYCLIQLFAGSRRIALFGIQEFTLQGARIKSFESRLMGPFNAVGITAEYLVLQIAVIGYYLMCEKHKIWRFLAYGLLPANLGFLVATGNRGGIFVLVLGGLLYVYMFRKEFGLKRILVGGTLIVTVFMASAFIMVKYSQFDVLFNRLEKTSIESGVPDTRADIWPIIWEKITESPIIGYGPRFRLTDDDLPASKQTQFLPYPHDLYLYLWFTLGIFGLSAYLIFYLRLLYLFTTTPVISRDSPWLKYSGRLGVIVMVVFLFDQIKLSSMRGMLSDYQQYFYVLIGTILALTVIARFNYSHENNNDV